MKDWKQSEINRRDSRSAKDPEVVKPIAGKKDTKRWCRGKVGREHITECRKGKELKCAPSYCREQWRILICKVCGKELDNYYGFGSEEKPKWVTF